MYNYNSLSLVIVINLVQDNCNDGFRNIHSEWLV